MVHDRLGYFALIGALLVFLVSACNEPSSDAPIAAPNWPDNQLMEVVDLNYWMAQPEVVLVDIRLADRYLTGHIPGAIHITRKDLEDSGYEYKGMRAGRKQLEDLLSKKGIKSTDKLILYDARGQVEAARFWWIMRCQGHSSLALLNGGVQAWKSAGKKVCTDNCDHRSPTTYRFVNTMDSKGCVEMEELTSLYQQPSWRLVDTREVDEFSGTRMKKGASRAGHIPGAIRINYTESLQPDYTFKSIDSLRTLFEENGLQAQDSIVVYCHSGVRSSHTFFVLTQLLGYTNVKNYDGSWVEWSYYDSLPADTLVPQEIL